MKLNFDNIPESLKALNQWVCWGKPGKPPKIPYNPVTGYPAKAGQPETWTSFNKAVEAVKAGRYKGVGFELNNNGIVGIDLDNVVDPETGYIVPEAKDIVTDLDSYTEISQSRKGLHVLVKADLELTENRSKLKDCNISGEKWPGIEVYNKERYLIVTGDKYGENKDIEERNAITRATVDYYFKPQDTTEYTGIQRNATAYVGIPMNPTVSPAAQLKIGLEKDSKLKALWNGDRPNGNESADDQGLMNKLAYWLECDPALMEAYFLSSPHIAGKDTDHQKKLKRKDYLKRTIETAIKSCNRTASQDSAVYLLDQSRKTLSKSGNSKQTLEDLHPEKNSRYGWNDIGNGNLFADWFHDKARYVPERKKWYIYNGKVWKQDHAGLKAMELCKKLADQLMKYALSIPDETTQQKYINHIKKWQYRRNRETILKDAASVSPIDFSEFDTKPFLLNCQNGTLDLNTREFRPHNAEDMLTKISAVNYDPNANCERWERFIDEIMQGDKEKAVFLQKALGYTLTGDTEYECFFILYGPTTRNGKGTCMETFRRLMKDYGATARPETLSYRQKTNSSAPSEDIARLAGARFVNVSEPDQKMILSASLVKTLTGRDTISARNLNESTIEYVPQFKLFINTNHLPSVTDPTVFSSGRVKLIPFERHFTDGERDTSLKDTLTKPENMSGIFNWCLEGLWLIRECGFEPPESVRAATDEYRKQSDKIGRFVAEEMEADSLAETRTSEAYTRYKEWCQENGHYPENSANFNALMETIAPIRRQRPHDGGEKTTLILGYKLNMQPGASWGNVL